MKQQQKTLILMQIQERVIVSATSRETPNHARHLNCQSEKANRPEGGEDSESDACYQHEDMSNKPYKVAKVKREHTNSRTKRGTLRDRIGGNDGMAERSAAFVEIQYNDDVHRWPFMTFRAVSFSRFVTRASKNLLSPEKIESSDCADVTSYVLTG